MVFGSSGHTRMPRCVLPSFTRRYPYDFHLSTDRNARRLHNRSDVRANDGSDVNVNGGRRSEDSGRGSRFVDDDDGGGGGGGGPGRRRLRAPTSGGSNQTPGGGVDPFHRHANGVALVKSFVRLDALPNQAWNPAVSA
jgi:hypothetical protein